MNCLIKGVLDQTLSLGSKIVHLGIVASSSHCTCLLRNHVLNHALYLLIALWAIKIQIYCRNYLLVFPAIVIVIPAGGLLVTALSYGSVTTDSKAMATSARLVAIPVVTCFRGVVVYICLHLFFTLLFLFFIFFLVIFPFLTSRLINFITHINLNVESFSWVNIWYT